MLLILILNIVFSAAVVLAIVGLLGSAIASERSEHGRSRVRRRQPRWVAWPAARWWPQREFAYSPR